MVRKESVPLSGTISKREKTPVTIMTTEFSAVHIQKKKQTGKLGFIQWTGTKEGTMTNS